MKYGYDRSVLKGLGVGPFLGLEKARNAVIGEAPDTPPQSIFNANRLAKSLHPDVQHATIAAVTDHGGARSYKLVPDRAKGTEKMAFFRASQYVSVALDMGGGVHISKPYTIRSAPHEALGEESSYTLTIKLTDPAYASKHILDAWKQGDPVDISGPLGDFYYQRLRDAGHVVAIAGGSGITPFCSMASAIADGDEDFAMTILYGSRTAGGILLKDEIEQIAARSGGRVKVVHVLSDEEAEGFEHGFITAELIKKYAPEEDFSLFMCGPKAMYDFAEKEAAKLGLPGRRVRREMSGDYMQVEKAAGYPQEASGKTFSLMVDIRGTKRKIEARGGESLMWAMERAGIAVPSHCRSGECGWCHSRLVSGDVFIPPDADGRRLADVKFGWIHPCGSFPLSDAEIQIFPKTERT